MERINENNQLTVRGKIINELEFAYEVAGEQFFRTTISVPRTSGSVDELQVIVSERLLDVNDSGLVGQIVNIYGEFRSFNKNADDGRRKLILTVFVKEIKFEDEYDYSNKANCIRLVGTVCNKPFCRETPLGRTIADLTLAVNRGFGKSDYIPCVLWGRNAQNKSALITNPNHLVLKCAHPSPLSAYNGFFGCNHFKLCNEFLVKNNLQPIDWQIENI